MALLRSFESNKSISITPISYENSIEDWIQCEIIFTEEDKIIFKKIASILQASELVDLLDGIKAVLIDADTSYNSDFLEPNLKVTIRRAELDTFLVEFDYVEGEDYENRTNEKNFRKNITFKINAESANNFIDKLQLEKRSVIKG